MHRIGIIFGLILVCVFSFLCYELALPTVSDEKGVVYFLPPGMSKKALIDDLSARHLIRHQFIFKLYTYGALNASLKTGEYVFLKGSNPLSIWRQVTSGRGLLQYAFTIVPGWTFAELREALAKAPALKSTIATLSNADIMAGLRHPDLNPEGQFYPDTYFYTKDIRDRVILQKAFTLMQSKLATLYATRAPGLPYENAYQALIAASLVEKEAYLNEERPIIAGVLINRLHQHMPLQFDPTVIYGMGSQYQGRIRKQDLLQDTPYNTYIHKGLPQTPIAIPSLASLQAVLHPAKHDYLYFVAKGNGAHQFSTTLVEHNLAVNASLKRSAAYFNEGLIRHYIEMIWRKSS